MIKDALGERMKDFYEDRVRYYLPRRSYALMRLDGRAFHTWTRGLKRPFDIQFQTVLDETTRLFCKSVQGAVFAYTQSDEISILIIDFDPTGGKLNTSAWFDYNIQKMCSVGASTFTAIFNSLVPEYLDRNPAVFDARVFTIADRIEVYNYFVWRQADAVRNSISSSAQSFYSHTECFGKNGSQLQEMIFQKGQNWNDYPARFKRGGFIFYDKTTKQEESRNVKTNEVVTYERPNGWSILPEIPVFTQNPKWLIEQIPPMHT